MGKSKITKKQMKQIVDLSDSLKKEGKLKAKAIYADIAKDFDISENYCANLCRQHGKIKYC